MNEGKQKNRRIAIIDRDGKITEMLEELRDKLTQAQSIVVMNDTTLIRALIVSAHNKFKREMPEKINLENLFQ